MDRISAIRNVEEALADLEAGEIDLETAEERVVTVVRTFATDFGPEEDRRAYRARGDPPADGTVVVAGGRREARERVRAVADAEEAEFDLEHVG
ncbi:MAG: hypothetical protein ABEJ30_05255 [Halorientalis sp.]